MAATARSSPDARATGEHPTTTVAGLEANTLADGLFHALAFTASLAGLFLVWSSASAAAAPTGRRLLGLMLAGWGLFNLVEGLVDHQILTVHHVNPDAVVLWDALFLAFGAALLVGGLLLARGGGRAAPRVRAGRPAPPIG